jgi:hypothetical protein
MATQNSLHVPYDLLIVVNEAARAARKTTDEIVADALRRYLAHRDPDHLGQHRSEHLRRLDYTEADVPCFIAESRRADRRH